MLIISKTANGYVGEASEPQDWGEVEELELNFPGPNVLLAGLMADIHVRASRKPYATVKLCAHATQMSNITLRQQDGMMVVREKPRHDRPRHNNVKIGAIEINAVVGDGSNLTVGGRGAVADPERFRPMQMASATIWVPSGHQLSIVSKIGVIKIDDINADLRLELSGSATVQAGIIRNLQAKLSGASTVSIAMINGDVACRTSGSSVVKVTRGNIGDLDVNASSNSDVRILATAQSAKLNVTGNGKIFVDQVAGSIEQRSELGLGAIVTGEQDRVIKLAAPAPTPTAVVI